MRTFTSETIKAIRGRLVFKKLLINEKCLLDQFEESIKGTPYESEMRSIYTYMEFVANNTLLPRTKLNVIKKCYGKQKCYEFKSKNLRVYAFSITGGKVIVLGGNKSNQVKDIRQLKSILKDIIESNQLNKL
ncbi:MAG: hypothetical protein GX877_01275 [Bacteroidales bacterium]|nr:hypothetical protein [Bacteroidales bacterium]